MNTVRAVSYLRTSSATNVGPDKDSDKRQRAAVEGFAASTGYVIEREFYDAAVSGADPVTERPGFSDLLEYCAAKDIHSIIIESPDRFARDTMVGLLGYEMLKKSGIELIPTTAPTYFSDPHETAELIRTILTAVSSWERKGIVRKLRAARDRKRAKTGRCEGRPPAPEATRKKARWLADNYPNITLRSIAHELARDGMRSPSGSVYSPSSIKAMLK